MCFEPHMKFWSTKILLTLGFMRLSSTGMVMRVSRWSGLA